MTYFSEAQTKALQAPLDPKHVVKPSGNFGPKGDYIEGWHCINELNRVFGFDGWSYTINLTRDALEKGQDSRGNEQWQAAYTCICTLTVGPVTRQDVGFGSGFAKGVGDAIEGATKEAVTDALKRAARTFGNIFGLALYDKTRCNVQAPIPDPAPVITEAQRTELMGMLDNMNVPVGPFLQVGNISDLSELAADQFDLAKRWINKQAAKRAEQKEAA
jgi:DNA recombination protein Rad52